jgi:F0F1-type ATP synthase assembly protein I
MTAMATVRSALPYILVGGAVGALVGSFLGDIPNGFRVGVVLGGAIAFIVIRKKKIRAS